MASETIRILQSTERSRVARLLAPTRVRDAALERRVARIIDEVRTNGDRALQRYAQQLDGLRSAIEVPRSAWEREAAALTPQVRSALRHAARHIRRVARAQLPRGFRTAVAAGIRVEQRIVPLERVGCYVPGGRYPLPSSLLMTAIPARIAGVREVVAVCSRLDPAVLAAAVEAGVDRFFQIGGAHAVAALAYGTETVPRVAKIVGPGNRWVSAAKALVGRDCAIDFYAGPTEIIIVATRGRASWIAADLVAQAEHDVDARAIFITANRRLATAVAREVALQAPPTGPARTALRRNGGIVITKTIDEAISLTNEAAPEHLVVDREALARKATNVGAIFVGPWTAQVAGDYAIGSNHVLPTAGAARFRGGLNTADFVRLVSVQRVSRKGLIRLSPTVITLARAEGLEAHARSIEIRQGGQAKSRRSSRANDASEGGWTGR